jgi:cytochrome c heme-lyase
MTPSPTDSISQSAGRCPVDHKSGNTSLWKVLGVKSSSTTTTPSQEESIKNIPASVEEAAKHAQTPHPDQRLPLSTHRASSSIQRGETDETPHHQQSAEASAASNWVYPSEQQVFNAMKRKGWKGVEEESIPSFLQIHNSVNERSWRQLLEWESTEDIQLVSFKGRPNDLTPKAWILSNLLFQEKPFDRHDWVIDNGVEPEKRYVLDFYMNESAHSDLPRVEIDVRPALDTPQALVARTQRVASELFPGITKELQKWQASRSTATTTTTGGPSSQPETGKS